MTLDPVSIYRRSLTNAAHSLTIAAEAAAYVDELPSPEILRSLTALAVISSAQAQIVDQVGDVLGIPAGEIARWRAQAEREAEAAAAEAAADDRLDEALGQGRR